MNLIVKSVLLLINYTIFIKAENIDGGRIIGGHESKPYNHPYLVSLQTRLLWFRYHVCGGSILNEEWVLTAAHCTKQSWLIRWLSLDAVAGTHNIDNFGPKAQIRTVDQRIEHPFYEGGIGPHDIAVLHLQIPFEYTDVVQPIHLPYNNFKMNNNSLMLAGWGALKTTIFIPDLPNGLQEVIVTYIPYDECRKAIDAIKDRYEYNPLDKNANICTGPISGGVAACSGDSGGPLIQFATKNKFSHRTEEVEEVYDEVHDETPINNKPVEQSINGNETETIPIIRGIVSWGMSPCGDKGAPTVYTKISQYVDFINAYSKLKKKS